MADNMMTMRERDEHRRKAYEKRMLRNAPLSSTKQFTRDYFFGGRATFAELKHGSPILLNYKLVYKYYD